MAADYDYSIHYRRWHSESPEHYEALAKHYQRWLGAMLAGIPTDGRVLDFGCGFGGLLHFLRRRYPAARGVDSSRQQVEVAARAGLPVEWVTESDFERWSGELRGHFDAIFLFDVLEHVPREEQIGFMRCLVGMLKSRGLIFIKVPNARSLLGTQWLYTDWTHINSFTDVSLEFVCANAGLSELEYLRDDSSIRPKYPWIPRWGLRSYYVKVLGRALWKLYLWGEMGAQARSMSVGYNLLARARKP